MNRVGDFVAGFITDISTFGLSNNVLGWYLADEPHFLNGSDIRPSLADYTAICERIHDVQRAYLWNKPFDVVFYMDGNWAADNQSIDFAQWVGPWVEAVALTVGNDARMVIVMDYYPWDSGAQDFKAKQSGSPAARSPYYRWSRFIRDTNDRYVGNPYVVGIQAAVQGWSNVSFNDLSRIPGHTDMHQQIRAVRNFMSEPNHKPGGVWLYAWGRGASGEQSGQNLLMAWNRWTQAGTEQYAEAVQNEIDLAVEGIPGVVPNDNTVIAVLPECFYRVNFANPAKNGGTWIRYNQKDRGVPSFSIKRPDGVEVRRLEWDYSYASVQQQAFNTVVDPPGKWNNLGGTAICFDGLDASGNLLPRYPEGQNYTVQMLLNGNPVGAVLPLVVQDATLPFRLPMELGLVVPHAY